MGLDMYLNRRHYVQRWDHIPTEKQFAVTVTRGGKPYAPIKSERVSYVIEQVAYWRKANAIHRWFVENVQNGNDDCHEYSVSNGQLQALLDAVNAVLNAPALAAEMLPTQSGFFFGSTEYDEDYIADLEETKRQLEPLMHEEDGEYFYRSIW